MAVVRPHGDSPADDVSKVGRLAERPLEARILWRPGLAAGTEIAGPAVIEEPNSTTLVGPGDRAIVNDSGHIMIALAERA